MAGQNSNFVINDVTIAESEAEFYHYDVVMAKFENLASQTVVLHINWESNFGGGLQFLFFVAVNRQITFIVFLLSFSNPDHHLSKQKEI